MMTKTRRGFNRERYIWIRFCRSQIQAAKIGSRYRREESRADGSPARRRAARWGSRREEVAYRLGGKRAVVGWSGSRRRKAAAAAASEGWGVSRVVWRGANGGVCVWGVRRREETRKQSCHVHPTTRSEGAKGKNPIMTRIGFDRAAWDQLGPPESMVVGPPDR